VVTGAPVYLVALDAPSVQLVEHLVDIGDIRGDGDKVSLSSKPSTTPCSTTTPCRQRLVLAHIPSRYRAYAAYKRVGQDVLVIVPPYRNIDALSCVLLHISPVRCCVLAGFDEAVPRGTPELWSVGLLP
jgi:hypothetical protein